MRKISCLPVIVLLLTFLNSAISAKILFEDDFEGNDFDDKWVVVVGNWEVKKVDGNTVAAHDVLGPGSETILIRDMIFDDFIAEVRMRHVSDNAGAQIYWATNEGPENASGEGYLFGENASGDTIRWYRVTGGSPELQDEIPNIDIAPDTWTWFKVRVEGSHAEMWYKREGKDNDYILAFDVDDLDEYDKGAIATWVGNEVLIDDVLVTDLQGAAVEPIDGLVSTWGRIKSGH